MFSLPLPSGGPDALPARELLWGELLTGEGLRWWLGWLGLWGRWWLRWLWVGHCSIQVVDMTVTLSLSSLPLRCFLPLLSLCRGFILLWGPSAGGRDGRQSALGGVVVDNRIHCIHIQPKQKTRCDGLVTAAGE